MFDAGWGRSVTAVLRLASVGGADTDSSRAALDIRPSRGVGLVRINTLGSGEDRGIDASSNLLDIRGSLLVTPSVSAASKLSWSYWRVDIGHVGKIDGATRFDVLDATAGEFVINSMRVRSTASLAEGGAAAATASARCSGVASNGILGIDGCICWIGFVESLGVCKEPLSRPDDGGSGELYADDDNPNLAPSLSLNSKNTNANKDVPLTSSDVALSTVSNGGHQQATEAPADAPFFDKSVGPVSVGEGEAVAAAEVEWGTGAGFRLGSVGLTGAIAILVGVVVLGVLVLVCMCCRPAKSRGKARGKKELPYMQPSVVGKGGKAFKKAKKGKKGKKGGKANGKDSQTHHMPIDLDWDSGGAPGGGGGRAGQTKRNPLHTLDGYHNVAGISSGSIKLSAQHGGRDTFEVGGRRKTGDAPSVPPRPSLGLVETGGNSTGSLNSNGGGGARFQGQNSNYMADGSIKQHGSRKGAAPGMPLFASMKGAQPPQQRGYEPRLQQLTQQQLQQLSHQQLLQLQQQQHQYEFLLQQQQKAASSGKTALHQRSRRGPKMPRNPAKIAKQQNLLSPVAELHSPAQSPLPQSPLPPSPPTGFAEFAMTEFIDDDAITVGGGSCTDDLRSNDGDADMSGNADGGMFDDGSVPPSDAEMRASKLFDRLASDHLSSEEEGASSESDLDLSGRHSCQPGKRGSSINSFNGENDVPPPLKLDRHPSLRYPQVAPRPAARQPGGSLSAPSKGRGGPGGMAQASFRESTMLQEVDELAESPYEVPAVQITVTTPTTNAVAAHVGSNVTRNLGLFTRNTSVLSEESTEDEALESGHNSSAGSSQFDDDDDGGSGGGGTSDMFRSMLEMRQKTMSGPGDC